MKPTALIYSSHNRCEYLHRYLIVERALQSTDNKTILYLPFSMRKQSDQEYSWGTFIWYFDKFKQWGLQASVFFYNSGLKSPDMELLIQQIKNVEVLILGGGNTTIGFEQYGNIGSIYNGDKDLFKNLLHERQRNGKLTVGFSAGALQLSDFCLHDNFYQPYSLIHNVSATLHHDYERRNELFQINNNSHNVLAFGLPNDSGIASNQGFLPSGNKWQILEFVIDNSWDAPEDYYHIKTRQGMGIEHFYKDGRNWTFFGGDRMLKIISPDYTFQGTWIVQPNSDIVWDYWTQQPSHYHNIEHILSMH